MESEICYKCHRLTYIAIIDNRKYHYDDIQLTRSHTRSSCESKQNQNSVENKVKNLEDIVEKISLDLSKIKEKIGFE